MNDGAPDALDSMGLAFSESLLHLPPKKAIGETDEGVAMHDARATRPLNVANTDNRVIAGAVRLLLEPLPAPAITTEQDGFLQGRSMI
eukprot:930248-Pyramimonas_sp.AAC.1